ncbi:MAG: hypothetical protein GC192_08860 [Bacteroidetes bacterium]|nr:hypothetical protein [Bacteroidota bacterium]
MRKILFLCFLSISISLSAQQFSRVKIKFDENQTLEKLAGLGLEVDHGKLQPGKYLIGEFSSTEIDQMRSAGFSTEVLIPDLVAHRQFLEQQIASTEERVLPPCEPQQPTNYQTPANYHAGTMGGYFKYQEMLDMVDQMAALYPNLVKARTPITNAYTTIEGRPIYWLKISDNPNVDEDEPEVLYDAVHHAREPNSMSQLIFYMWYLLENYDTDPEIKYLVDNTEMYFVPCVNPDGYIYNETTNPNGSGFWRKNRRDNGNGTFGIDLNRNYGYKWGFDNSGSSPNPNSETYRGTEPFSEPETQMMRDFCLAHHFQIALNYHTYGNLLIYPWGWVDGASPDHATFSTFGPYLTRENDFLTGFGSQTVGYTTNGDSDDWMYGEQSTKPKIYSMTPEVGPDNYGFWPPSIAIDDLNRSNMTMNLTAAHLVLNFGVLTPGGDRFLSQQQGSILFSLKKMGLASGQLTVKLEPVSSNIAAVGNPINYGMFHLEEASNSIPFTLKSTVQDGELVQFNLVLDNGLYQWRTPVERVYTSLVQTNFLDAADNGNNWNTGGWSLTNEQYHSAPTSFTDSPNGQYDSNSITEIELKNPVKVKDATSVVLSYWAKWDIEEDEDYVQILGNFNNIGYQSLCGKYTEAGTDQQVFLEPLYDGHQQNWVREEIDLTEWLVIGDSVNFKFAFKLVSDEAIQEDGFYFDDFELKVVKNGGTTSTLDFDTSDFTLTTRPNPASDHVIIDLKGENIPNLPMQLQVFNALGQLVDQQVFSGQIYRLETGNWEQGFYQYRISVGGNWLPAGRFLISK